MGTVVGVVLLVLLVGYGAYRLGKMKGLSEGREEGESIGRALGYLEGWMRRHSGEEIPEWVTSSRWPDWLLNKSILLPPTNEEIVLYGTDEDGTVNQIRDEKLRQTLNKELRDQTRVT
jgi:hypothetical protein